MDMDAVPTCIVDKYLDFNSCVLLVKDFLSKGQRLARRRVGGAGSGRHRPFPGGGPGLGESLRKPNEFNQTERSLQDQLWKGSKATTNISNIKKVTKNVMFSWCFALAKPPAMWMTDARCHMATMATGRKTSRRWTQPTARRTANPVKLFFWGGPALLGHFKWVIVG